MWIMDVNSQKGQGLLEFIMMFPLLMVLFFILFQYNAAIQNSINSQRFGRGRLFELLANSAFYPKTSQGALSVDTLPNANQYFIGVSDQIASEDTNQQSLITHIQHVIGFQSKKLNPINVRQGIMICTPNYYLSNTQFSTSGIDAIGNVCGGNSFE